MYPVGGHLDHQVLAVGMPTQMYICTCELHCKMFAPERANTHVHLQLHVAVPGTIPRHGKTDVPANCKSRNCSVACQHRCTIVHCLTAVCIVSFHVLQPQHYLQFYSSIHCLKALHIFLQLMFYSLYSSTGLYIVRQFCQLFTTHVLSRVGPRLNPRSYIATRTH
eukprot:jgi/Botrbrau1/9338/Bobra.0086s0022.1